LPAVDDDTSLEADGAASAQVDGADTGPGSDASGGGSDYDAVQSGDQPPALSEGTEPEGTEDDDTVPRRPGAPTLVLALVGFGLVAVLAMQAYLLISASATSDQVDELEAVLDGLSSDLARVEGSVEAVGAQVSEMDASGAASSPATGSAPQAAVESGFLPRYEQGQQDLALGMSLATIEGDEYYSETAVSIDPADGTRRVWLIWAHWCPYCQEELPELSTWWNENADAYENIEIVTVTTSIDPSRGNPLEPYLDELQLPFSTVVDHDLTTAARFGTSAFPFWVVTDGDGTVLFRTAGLIPIEQVEAIFDQLRDIST
jgi:thiol-disulfide isomerase/thioredoxin